MDVTQTNLRYLLAVYTLKHGNNGTAAVDIARYLGVSKPSVTRMLGVLSQRGFLVKEPYGKVRLTPQGTLLAEEYAGCVDAVRHRLPLLELPLTEIEAAQLACLLVVSLPEHVRKTLHIANF